MNNGSSLKVIDQIKASFITSIQILLDHHFFWTSSPLLNSSVYRYPDKLHLSNVIYSTGKPRSGSTLNFPEGTPATSLISSMENHRGTIFQVTHTFTVFTHFRNSWSDFNDSIFFTFLKLKLMFLRAGVQYCWLKSGASWKSGEDAWSEFCYRKLFGKEKHI